MWYSDHPSFVTTAVVIRNRVVHLVIAGLLIAVFAVSCQSAQPGTPDGNSAGQAGPVMSLAVDAMDGSLLKAADGLFRSSDHGQTWQPLGIPADLHPDSIQQVATSVAAPANLYAAGPGVGVVRSDDSGKTWRMVSTGLPTQEVAAFTVHSFRPDTLYAWIEGQGIFRTEDSGERWQKMDAGPVGAVVALAHSTLEGSMNTGWLYAATPAGPYLSMDCF